MKINKNMDSYELNISLDELVLNFEEFKRQINLLSSLGTMLKHQLNQAQENFTSANYLRTEEAINNYLKKLSNSEIEINELIQSAKEFADKLKEIARPW